MQSNYEGVNALKLGMQKSGFRGREDTMKLIEALEGLEIKEGRRLPAGRQAPAQGGPPGLPPRVHLRDPGRQAPDPRGRSRRKRRSSRSPASSPSDGGPASTSGPRPATAGGRPRSAPAHRRPHHALRRPRRAQQRQPSVSRGTDPRHHRPERRGQVAPSSTASPACCARPRGASSSTARTSPGCRPTASRAGPSRARTRSPTSCPAPPCWRTCASPPSRAITAGACCATTAPSAT